MPAARTRYRPRVIVGVAAAATGSVAWLACFAVTVHALSGMNSSSEIPAGLLGIPWSAVGLTVFALVIGAGTVVAAAPVGTAAPRTPLAGGLVLILGGIGIIAAWALTADKVITLTRPHADLECNFSLLVQCGANLTSWQGAVFGFPNPLLGLAGWAAVLVIGAALGTGIRIPTWLWAVFTAGVTAAMGFVVWLISQSVFVLGTLCPWCMVTWAVTIPLFWFSWGELLRRAPSSRVSAAASGAIGWLPLITLLSYAAVAIIAQLRLDVIAYL